MAPNHTKGTNKQTKQKMIVTVFTVPAPCGCSNWLMVVEHNGISYPIVTHPKSKLPSLYEWDAEKLTAQIKDSIKSMMEYEQEKVNFLADDKAMKDYVNFLEMASWLLLNLKKTADMVYTDIDNGVYPESRPNTI